MTDQSLHIPSDPGLIEVPALGLRPGMYVAEIDRPWLETPFATQGFLVQDQDDIEYVAKHCALVYVDPRQANTQGLTTPRFDTRKRADKVDIRAQFSRAKVDFESASDAMERVFAKVRSDHQIDVRSMRNAIHPLIESVMRNAEAMSALARMREKGDYLYQHSLATTIWSAVVGRHLGLERDDLMELALGVSMMDLGMSSLPDALLAKSEALTGDELTLIRGHVKKSLELIDDQDALSRRSLNVIACHHERFDGSGYPQGLEGDALPLFAQIAGIVDTYDAMITPRPHAAARTSFEAVQELMDLKGSLFAPSLVEHFVQTIGTFPTGAVVELNTGEVGIVIQQNASRRLRPKIMIVRNAEKAPIANPKVIDLSNYASEDGTARCWISAELAVGRHGVEPHDYFL